MKKSDLKSSMVVETRNGNRYLVIRKESDELFFMNLGEFSYMPGDGFDEDLLFYDRDRPGSDIMKVYDCVFTICNAKEATEVLWEREEARRMTMGQIKDALGYPVEIVMEGQA